MPGARDVAATRWNPCVVRAPVSALGTLVYTTVDGGLAQDLAPRGGRPMLSAMGVLAQALAYYFVPLALTFLWSFRRASRAETLSRAVLLVGFAIAVHNLGFAGRYGIYAPHAFALGAVAGLVVSFVRATDAPLYVDGRDLGVSAARAAGGVVFAIAGASLASSARDTEGAPFNVTFPVKDGTFLVAAGGAGSFGVDVDGAAQRLAIDLVKLNAFGFRSGSLWPTAPEDFNAFDEPIYAPCDGTVLASEDDRPDLPPTQSDGAQPLGNFVAIGCTEATIVMTHLRRASIKAPHNSSVRVGELVARVGASGRAGEAKLRIYALRGRESQPARIVAHGTPVALNLGEGVLVRGDRVSR